MTGLPRNIHRQIEEERGVNIRNPSTALFGVSSADRYKNVQQRVTNPSSPFNFQLVSNQSFLNGFFTRIALTEAKFTWAIPTITERNYRMNISYNGAPLAPIQIGLGWFTPTTLADAVQTATRARTGNAGFTVVADVITGEFLAETNNADVFSFLPYINQTYPLKTGLYQMMNWQNEVLDNESQFSGFPSMLSTQFVDITCSQLTYNQDVKDGDTGQITRDVLARLYLTPQIDETNPELIGSQPFQIYRQFTFPKQIKWASNIPIGNLTFELYDDAGYLLTTGSTGAQADEYQPDWNVTLLVSEV